MSDKTPEQYVELISKSGLSIYDAIPPELLVPTPILQAILRSELIGVSTAGMANRTRSKFVKEQICSALGYPIPKSFKKTQPRYPGQNFDNYVQKSRNLQIWNEVIDVARRYVIVSVTGEDVIDTVKIVKGDVIAALDTTGTLTTKYQASLTINEHNSELVSPIDTADICAVLGDKVETKNLVNPIANPEAGLLLPISEIYSRLLPLVNTKFVDDGIDQERNRGAALHNAISEALGYNKHADDGNYPDIRHQLLEVKLQTSPTIDLGQHSPDSLVPLPIPAINNYTPKNTDVRYAIFSGETNGKLVTLTGLFVVTGEDFYARFTQFGGNVTNTKLQIPLPRDFFED